MNIIMKYISFLIFFTAFFLISCEKEIDFKGKEEAPRMVLNAILNPDTRIYVFLSESQFFLSPNTDSKNIRDAKVYLWRNGEMIQEMDSYGIYYSDDFIPSIGDKIKITAEHPDYPSIESAEVEIPAPVPLITIDTVDFKHYATKYSAIYTSDYIGDYTGDYPNDTTSTDSTYIVVTSSKIKITFNDPEKIKNYYRIFVGVTDKCYGKSELYNGVYCYSDDIVFSNSNMGLANTSRYNEFSDLLFDGETYTLTLCFYVGNSYDSSNIPDEREITVRLESICESNYKYYSSLSLFGLVGDGVFSEPVQIYSNIKGGMGVLGAYAVSDSTIRLSKWEEIDQDEYHKRRNKDWDEFWKTYERYSLGTIYAPYGY